MVTDLEILMQNLMPAYEFVWLLRGEKMPLLL